MQNATPEEMMAPKKEDNKPVATFGSNYMAKEVPPREDFIWSDTSEPHYKRKKAILAKHPEIRELYGPDPNTMSQVFFVVSMQTAIAAYMGFHDIHWGILALVAYFIGGFANHHLFLAVHEMAHGLAFESALANRALAFVANFPAVFPFAVSFQKYHLEHHQHQGVHDVDMDIPTYAEGKFAVNVIAKTLWVMCQLFFYALRPLFSNPKPAGLAELANLTSCAVYDYALYHYFGGKAIAYLCLSSFLGGGLHPIAGHFISEHYMFNEDQETYSYYGPLNWVIYYAGYHVEHHDFPRIPGSRLSQVHKLAPEFYENLAYHTSWSGCIWRYITDPKMGAFSRCRRTERASNKKSN